jgi:hypothetical protein
VRQIFGGNPYVPGYGRLIRQGGRRLDEAREAAHEAGYEIAGGGESTVRDLLNALDAEARGQKRYRMGHEPEATFDTDENRHRIEQHIDAAFDDAGLPRPTGDLRARMLDMPGATEDPIGAYERAVMEEHYAGTDEGRERPGLPPDLPRTLSDDIRRTPASGADIAGARAAAGAGPGREGAGTGAAPRQPRDAGSAGGGQGRGDPGAVAPSRATQAALADERRVIAAFDAQRSFLSKAELTRLDDVLRDIDLDGHEAAAVLRDGAACLLGAMGA